MDLSKVFVLLTIFSLQSIVGVKGQSNWKSISKRYETELSTEGLGVGIVFKNQSTWRFVSRLQYIGYQKKTCVTLDNQTYIDISPKINRFGLNLGTQRALYKNWISTEIGLNIMLLQQNKFKLNAPTGIDFEGLQIKAEDFGQVEVSLTWSPIQPYAKILLGRQSKKHLWQIKGFLGCTYMASPKLKVDYEGFWETTNLSTDLQTIEKNMKNYSFYPLIGVIFAFKE